MSLKKDGRLSRREMMKALSVAATGGSAAMSVMLQGCRDDQLTPERREQLGSVATRKDALGKTPKFIIVIAATGGASIVDSFMALRQSESANGATLNTFPDSLVKSFAGSPLRAVDFNGELTLGSLKLPVVASQSSFVNKHQSDMLVSSFIGTSVNHVIAQKRSLTGNGAWNGRTLQECVALEYGAAFPIPHVNMGTGGYLENGSDSSLPAYCYAESVANPSLWPLGLDGMRGIKNLPDRSLVELARKVRNEQLDPESTFARTFSSSDRLKRWYDQRGPSQHGLEAMDLITKLNVLPNQPPSIPLTEYGLAESPDAAKVRAAFPNFFTDQFEGQAAAAYLLLKNRVSVAVTIGPNFNVLLNAGTLGNPPLAFDFSHNDHRGTQAFMWNRILGVADRLITLLKGEPFPEVAGTSLWDHTLLYVATDFGRTKQRPSGAMQFGTGHDFNNGHLLVSPLVKGNTVLGSVSPTTLLSSGFDPETGAPDTTKTLSNDRDLFAGILHALSVDTSGSGLPDARAFRRKA